MRTDPTLPARDTLRHEIEQEVKDIIGHALVKYTPEAETGSYERMTDFILELIDRESEYAASDAISQVLLIYAAKECGQEVDVDKSIEYYMKRTFLSDQ